MAKSNPAPRPAPGNRRKSCVLVFATTVILVGCGSPDDPGHVDEDAWDVSVEVTEEDLVISATIGNAHGDFVHVSIRRDGYDSGYTIDRSPAPHQPERDWSRVHHWFGELHPNTYLEGRFDDGRGRGPDSFQTFTFLVPRAGGAVRESFPEIGGADYEYITRGYSYADGNPQHPAFDSGDYEIEIYAWYTGTATEMHPSADGSEGVQYVHYELPLTSTTFVVE